MKRIKLFVIFSFLLSLYSNSQEKYWVYLSDKESSILNPYEYFDIKAIERRIKNGVSLNDSTDYPLNQTYIQSITAIVDSVGFQSRWFNAVVVWAYEDQVPVLLKLCFVKGVQAMTLSPQMAEKGTEILDLGSDFGNIRNKQISSLEGQLFEPSKIDGEGVRIAVFDAGFPNVDKDKAFKHIRDQKRIIKTFDFTKNKENVYYASQHGTMVLSNISGVYESEKLGLATNAEFLLAKTEVSSEPLVEEEYWLAAVEWADKNGADIINSSLGYTHHRYFREQMDGTSLVARAGNMAFDKGILVVNAAGNEGEDKYWKYIGTPADASKVLSVGGISPSTDYHISFSSYGPTADGRMKPNVSAMGKVLVASKNGLAVAQGTSFSSPLVAGFAACVLQLNPSYTVKQLFDEIEKSAHLYPYYDYAHGFGVPKASYFLNKNSKPVTASFRTQKKENKFIISVLENIPHVIGQKNHLYYHVSKEGGFLKDYGLIDVYQQKALELDLEKYESGDIIRVFYKSYTKEYRIE